jgi:prepilin-type N-terminal cleavage/methylation domain-containing protein
MTLVEMLVVLGILAVLAALLYPALWTVIEAANSIRCQNRLRQIGIAYHRYMDESGGLWPPILSRDPPVNLFKAIEAETGLVMAPARPGLISGLGPHWSIVLWPYLDSLELYTCPSDPKAGLRGSEVIPAGREHTVALLDAPPESYALNVIMFRTVDVWRRQAGCTWGTHGEVDFSGLASYTTESEQRRLFGGLAKRILFFCGASGQTVGSQSNVPFRSRAGLSGAERWEWHYGRASAAFADEPGCGSNYLYWGGQVEYHDELPDLWAWGYELSRPPG